MHINPIQKRAGNSAYIIGNFIGIAAAGLTRIRIIPAGASMMYTMTTFHP